VSLRKAYQDMIKVHGVVDTATLLELTESALDNRVYERQGQAFTVRQSIRLQQISGLPRFAEEIARLSGGTFIKLPVVENIGNEDLFAKFRELHAELGELSAKWSQFTMDDELDAGEREKLKSIQNDIHRALEELMAMSFAVYCRHE
jgi:hypothetical protein